MACVVPVRRSCAPTLIAFVAGFGLLLSAPASVPLAAQGGTPDQFPAPYQAEVADSSVDYSDDIPAHIAVIDGRATLEREGRVEQATENEPLLAGDRLKTTQGRVEVLFSDGSALDLDEDTSVDLLSESLLRLRAGRVRIAIPRASVEDLGYRIDAAGSSALLRTGGEFRVSLDPRPPAPQIDLAVIRGVAELTNAYGRTVVRTGQHATATEVTEPTSAYPFNLSSYDPLDRWAEEQRNARLGQRSPEYLPADLRYYGGVLDTYGDWQYQPTHGYVWYPRVATTWRPYGVGRWSFIASFGWTWVGHDRWSWPTHHYGRWGLSGSHWYWIPGRRWAPAWVSWATAPGYVSWCPLGFDGRPIVGWGGIGPRHHDPWSVWTVVPARVFTHNLSPATIRQPRIDVRSIGVAPVVVSSVAVTRQGVAPGVWSQFEVRPIGPTISGVRRDMTRPLRAPTSRTVAERRGVSSGSRPDGVFSTGPQRNETTARPNSVDDGPNRSSPGPARNDAGRFPSRTDRNDPSPSAPRLPPGSVAAPRGVSTPRSVPPSQGVAPPRPAGDPGRPGDPSRRGGTGSEDRPGWPSRSSIDQGLAQPRPGSGSSDRRGDWPGAATRQEPSVRPTDPDPPRAPAPSPGRSVGDRRGGGVSLPPPPPSAPQPSSPSASPRVRPGGGDPAPQKSAPPPAPAVRKGGGAPPPSASAGSGSGSGSGSGAAARRRGGDS